MSDERMLKTWNCDQSIALLDERRQLRCKLKFLGLDDADTSDDP